MHRAQSKYIRSFSESQSLHLYEYIALVDGWNNTEKKT